MNKLFLSAGAAVLILTSAGCGTKSHYVDATDTTQAVLNSDRMSSADWLKITEEAARNLLSSPQFDDFLHDYSIAAKRKYMQENPDETEIPRNVTRPLLMLSTLRNNTGEHIDTKLLTTRLQEVLFNSGKVRFTTYAAGTGQDIDEATAGARDLLKDPNVDKSTVPQKGEVIAYNLSLGGVIIKQTASSGRDREISYMFSLTLTNNNTGEGVWTFTKEIKRQETKAALGL